MQIVNSGKKIIVSAELVTCTRMQCFTGSDSLMGRERHSDAFKRYSVISSTHNTTFIVFQVIAFSARLTTLDRAIAKGRSVCPAVRHTRDPRLNGTRLRSGVHSERVR